jgi:hypothetical protein
VKSGEEVCGVESEKGEDWGALDDGFAGVKLGKGEAGVTEFGSSFAFVSPIGAGLVANRDEDGSGFCSVVGFSAVAGFGTNRLLKGFAAAALGFSCSVDDVGLGANRLPVAGAWNKVLGWVDAWLALLEKSDGPVVEEEKLIDDWDGVG